MQYSHIRYDLLLMLRAQRILAVAGLALLAGILHVSLCEWVYKEQLNLWNTTTSAYVQFPLLVHQKDPPPPANPARMPRGLIYTGLMTERWIPMESAIVWGIAAPLFLLGCDVYLILGWRRANRAARGLCLHCGYDLRGRGVPSQSAGLPGAPTRCPECGK